MDAPTALAAFLALALTLTVLALAAAGFGADSRDGADRGWIAG